MRHRHGLGVGRRAETSKQIDQSVANTSRRDGTRVIYRLASPLLEQVWLALSALAAAQQSGFDQVAQGYLGSRTGLPTVSRELAITQASAGAVLIDVRPIAEYVAGHVPGAIHVPPEQVADCLESLPDGPVIAYCRGEYCVFADNAVRLLIAFGRQAARIEGGFPEWRLSGLPVVTGSEPGKFRQGSRGNSAG